MIIPAGYLASISAGGATRYTITAMNARQQTTAATYGSSLYGTWGFDDYGYLDWSKAQGGGTWLQDIQYTFNGVSGNLDYRQDNRKAKPSTGISLDILESLGHRINKKTW